MLRLNLDVSKCRGQCYDGAAVMAGKKNGVAKQIQDEYPKCLYTYCHGHALNLAVKDSISRVSVVNDVLETVAEIAKLVKKSPQRDNALDKFREQAKNTSKGVHEFCPTRWTVRGEALQAAINNYSELKELWTWSLEKVKDPIMKARIKAVKAAMPTFNFLFGCLLGSTILRQTDNLSRTLQSPKVSAAQGYSIAMDVVKTILNDRNEESFEMFWEMVNRKKVELNIDDPKDVRKMKATPKVQVGNSSDYWYPETPKDRYRKFYFEFIDNVAQCIRARFELGDFNKYKCIQEVLLKAICGQNFNDDLDEVVRTYDDDFDMPQLKCQLNLLKETTRSCGFNKFTIDDVSALFKNMDIGRRLMLNQVIKFAKLLLVLPATNAVSERSFSVEKYCFESTQCQTL